MWINIKFTSCECSHFSYIYLAVAVIYVYNFFLSCKWTHEKGNKKNITIEMLQRYNAKTALHADILDMLKG